MNASSTNPLDRLQSLTVADIMTRRVVTVPWCARMDEAAALLVKADATGAPVVDEVGRCIGVLSASDFLRFETLRADPGQYDPAGWPDVLEGQPRPQDSVRRFMSPAIQTVSPGMSLLKAAEIMCIEHIHRLVVLDSRSAPLGVVSTLDVLSALTAAVDEQCQHQHPR